MIPWESEHWEGDRNKMNKVVKGLFWKLMERFGVQGIQFVLQIILARILSPEHYGTLSMMIVFTTLANVFVQSGFNTALIQNKDVTEEDYSSVFWLSLSIAGLLYGVIFLAAPMIGAFYRMPDLVMPLRVLALTLFPGALNSVQLAKISREMDFKKVFYGNVSGILLAGIAGIVIALLGGGLWALVVQNLLNITVACVVMFASAKWRPRLVFNIRRVAELFRFGWKLLIASLLDTLQQSLSGLVIGRKYDSGTLGYFNRGLQFPQFVINAISGAMQSVLLPAMSEKQDDRQQVKVLMRNAMMVSTYIIFPMMAGLAAVSEPLIRLLLTEKWLPAVPYMQINCLAFAFYSVHVCNLQAINAMGRSDLFLKLEIIKKIYSLVILVIAVVCFDSPIAIAMTGVIGSVLGWYVNALPNKKLVEYPFLEQVRDLLLMIVMSVLMCVCVLLVGHGCTVWRVHDFVTLTIQVFVGVTVYVLLSVMVKPAPYRIAIEMVKGFRRKK